MRCAVPVTTTSVCNPDGVALGARSGNVNMKACMAAEITNKVTSGWELGAGVLFLLLPMINTIKKERQRIIGMPTDKLVCVNRHRPQVNQIGSRNTTHTARPAMVTRLSDGGASE